MWDIALHALFRGIARRGIARLFYDNLCLHDVFLDFVYINNNYEFFRVGVYMGQSSFKVQT